MSAISKIQEMQENRASTQYDVDLVGARHYIISTAAHLAAQGLRVAIFGKPLELWRDKMPPGMFLRSHWWATNLSDPRKEYGLQDFFRVSEHSACYPLPVQTFIDYSMWFQEQAVPMVDPVYVSALEHTRRHFLLTLADGRVVEATAVVMAVGLSYYQRIPVEYPKLPGELLSHSGDHNDFRRFAGQKVAIIGGGQSAVEYSALLHEAGAEVDLIARRPISWLAPDNDDPRPLIERLRAPNSAIAPGWKYWGLEAFPYLFQGLAQVRKDGIINNNHHPGGSDWLRERVIGKVTLHEGQTVTSMEENDRGVGLALADNTHLQVEHVILATGYEADIRRLPMLSPTALAQIKTHLGSPILNQWFESSIPGLYFVGFSALQSFGPLYRFVGGVPATAPRVARAVAHRVARVH